MRVFRNKSVLLPALSILFLTPTFASAAKTNLADPHCVLALSAKMGQELTQALANLSDNQVLRIILIVEPGKTATAAISAINDAALKDGFAIDDVYAEGLDTIPEQGQVMLNVRGLAFKLPTLRLIAMDEVKEILVAGAQTATPAPTPAPAPQSTAVASSAANVDIPTQISNYIQSKQSNIPSQHDGIRTGINSILANPNFQRDPLAYIQSMRTRRGFVDHLDMPGNAILKFFESMSVAELTRVAASQTPTPTSTLTPVTHTAASALAELQSQIQTYVSSNWNHFSTDTENEIQRYIEATLAHSDFIIAPARFVSTWTQRRSDGHSSLSLPEDPAMAFFQKTQREAKLGALAEIARIAYGKPSRAEPTSLSERLAGMSNKTNADAQHPNLFHLKEIETQKLRIVEFRQYINTQLVRELEQAAKNGRNTLTLSNTLQSDLTKTPNAPITLQNWLYATANIPTPWTEAILEMCVKQGLNATLVEVGYGDWSSDKRRTWNPTTRAWSDWDHPSTLAVWGGHKIVITW